MVRPSEADDEEIIMGDGAGATTLSTGELPDAAEYCRYGVSVKGVEAFLRANPFITPACTTSDVCHKYVKPLTTPAGWTDIVSVVSAKRGWYSHTYVHKSGRSQRVAPAGTCSFCECMSADPATADYIGPPTVFFSHAWMFRFTSVVAAMRAYEETQPVGSPTVFFWFDCFSIDEHATQAFPPAWWDTTFLDAIRLIGHTVMYLSPWDNPVPLQRAWCLWEVLCTISAGADFDVCLGLDEREAFELALQRDLDSVLSVVGAIDAEQAEAGDPADKERIFAAILRLLPRGFMDLNNQVKNQLREWTYNAGSAALDAMPPDERLKSRLLDDLIQYFTKQGQYERAVPLCTEAVSGRRAAFGDADQRTLDAISSLGMLYSDRGEHDLAEPLLHEALLARRKTLGCEHAQTLQAINSLALLFFEMGEYAKAEPLYNEAISAYRKAGTSKEASALTALNNFGLLYCEWGKFDMAEPLMQEALHGRRDVLGNTHPDTLITIIYNGWMYTQIPDYQKAQPLIEEAIPNCQKVLGDDHPKTLSAINLHGLMHLNMGNFVEALPPSQQALAARRKTLGETHPLTLISLTNLGKVHHGMENYQQARILLEEAVDSSRKILGMDHLRTAQRIGHLADVYASEGLVDSAEQLYTEALTNLRRTVGDDHTATLHVVRNYGDFLSRCHGRLLDAHQLLTASLAEPTVRSLGKENEGVALVVRCLKRVQAALQMEEISSVSTEARVPEGVPPVRGT
jgi:tetratricopeptide (TPR) repeat protein